jgi:hypothetical protein
MAKVNGISLPDGVSRALQLLRQSVTDRTGSTHGLRRIPLPEVYCWSAARWTAQSPNECLACSDKTVDRLPRCEVQCLPFTQLG